MQTQPQAQTQAAADTTNPAETNRTPASHEPATEETGILGPVAQYRTPLLASLALLAAGIGGLTAWRRRNPPA
jgi:hypothetical protein